MNRTCKPHSSYSGSKAPKTSCQIGSLSKPVVDDQVMAKALSFFETNRETLKLEFQATKADTKQSIQEERFQEQRDSQAALVSGEVGLGSLIKRHP